MNKFDKLFKLIVETGYKNGTFPSVNLDNDYEERTVGDEKGNSLNTEMIKKNSFVDEKSKAITKIAPTSLINFYIKALKGFEIEKLKKIAKQLEIELDKKADKNCIVNCITNELGTKVKNWRKVFNEDGDLIAESVEKKILSNDECEVDLIDDKTKLPDSIKQKFADCIEDKTCQIFLIHNKIPKYAKTLVVIVCHSAEITIADETGKHIEDVEQLYKDLDLHPEDFFHA